MSTTVSSTPCCRGRGVERRPDRRRALAWLLGGLLALAVGTVAAQSPQAELTQLRLERAEDGVYLSAAVQFELPQGVEDVLDKGLAVYFVAEAELYRERWYWTDRKIGHAARYARLAYQPLTRRWRVNSSPLPINQFGVGVALNQNFDTLTEALGAIKRIGRLRLAELGEVGDDAAYPVQFRFRLDNTQLPRPFQIGVAGQSDWNLALERNVRLPLEKHNGK